METATIGFETQGPVTEEPQRKKDWTIKQENNKGWRVKEIEELKTQQKSSKEKKINPIPQEIKKYEELCDKDTENEFFTEKEEINILIQNLTENGKPEQTTMKKKKLKKKLQFLEVLINLKKPDETEPKNFRKQFELLTGMNNIERGHNLQKLLKQQPEDFNKKKIEELETICKEIDLECFFANN